MASNSSNSTNVSPIPVGINTSGMDQFPARFSQKFITGKVIRLQAHVYVFVCSHCDAEFRSPNGFMQHCEMHYVSNPTMMPYYPSSSFPEPISPASNRVSTGFGSATMPSLPSLPPFNSNYNRSSPYLQPRRWPQYNSMAYSNQPSSIAPRQPNNSSWSDCSSPIGGIQNAVQIGVVDHQQQIQPMEQQQEFNGMSADVTEVPDHDIYEIYDLGYDESSAVAVSGEPKKKKRSKSKTGVQYKCEFCSKPYSRRTSLMNHYESTHKQTSNESRPNATA